MNSATDTKIKRAILGAGIGLLGAILYYQFKVGMPAQFMFYFCKTQLTISALGGAALFFILPVYNNEGERIG